MCSFLPHDGSSLWTERFLRRQDEFLRSQRGPIDQWRSGEDKTALRGLSLNDVKLHQAGADVDLMTAAFGGALFPLRDGFTPVICEDYSSYTGCVAAGKELDRLAAAGKIHWYEGDSAPPDLAIAPSSVVLKPDKVRVVHDWSALQGGPLNAFMGPVEVFYGTMDQWLEMIYPGAWMAGIDFVDCFLHWMVHPSQRRLLGLRHPLTGTLGCYCFLPFGVGPCPGMNDWFVKRILRLVRLRFPSAAIIDFVDDLRLTKVRNGLREEVESLHRNVRDFLEDLGCVIHSKEGKWIPPTQRIGWLGHDVDSLNMLLQVQEAKRAKCRSILEAMIQGRASGDLRVKTVASCVGLMNFVALCVPGGLSHMRPWWNCINDTGVHAVWRIGSRANPLVRLSARGLADARWWVSAMRCNFVTPFFATPEGCFLWHARISDPLRWIRLRPHEDYAVITTDAAGHGFASAVWGERVFREDWPPDLRHASANMKELTAFRMCLHAWQGELRRVKLILWKSDSVVALRYVNGGSGRFADLCAVTDMIHLQLRTCGARVVGVHLAGRWNTVADAISRGYVVPGSSNECNHKILRDRHWKTIMRILPGLRWEMMCHPEGLGCRLKKGGDVDDSSLERPLPAEPSWWFPDDRMRALTVKHILKGLKSVPPAEFAILVPGFPTTWWFRLCQRSLKQAWVFPKGSALFYEISDDGEKCCGKTNVSWHVFSSDPKCPVGRHSKFR